ERMRIVFFGLPIAALCLEADGHEIALAALSRADAVGVRRLERKLGAERVVFRTEISEASLVARASAALPDSVVSWFWTTKLPVSVMTAARLGGIGVHPSLLPRHRGPDPYFAAIDQGDEETGVTAHRLDGEYDTGAILGQIRVRLDPS